jgi:2-polyprenyl-3-methyl-5-hydroxy-6-metoxy-1,4-benzoquinol methylase
MERFLPQHDELAEFINNHASLLYQRLKLVRIENLQLAPHYLEYFRTSHYKRLFFSVETSAHLLYRAIQIKKKPASEIVIMDYGAGIGTLFILAKMIGCKKVVYNDLFEEWRNSAQQILNAVGVAVDEYIVGDIDFTLEALVSKGIRCDVIISRNVIEHIYKLDFFYKAIRRYQPGAVVLSSTTANLYNPATHIQHILMHRRYEKIFHQQRREIVIQNLPKLESSIAEKISKKTRGLGGDDLHNAINNFRTSNKISPIKGLYTNTCDPYKGVWAEHLLTFDQYRQLIGEGFHIIFEPGFWDTHYKRSSINLFSKMMNRIIRLNKTLGIILAPFIYVIAIPREKT